MNYKKFLKLSPKKFFVWLGLFLGTGYIVYLFSLLLEDLPSFGFPLPFYRFEGYMMGVFLPPRFDLLSFILDVIFWYVIFIQESYIRFLKPNKKKIFVWLGLFFGAGYIMYLLSSTTTDILPFFGFPLPFYYFGGRTMTGFFLTPKFDFLLFMGDVIFWYVISCLTLE